MAYKKIFSKLYPNGWKDKPTKTTPIKAEALNRYDNALVHIENAMVSVVERAQVNSDNLNLLWMREEALTNGVDDAEYRLTTVESALAKVKTLAEDNHSDIDDLEDSVAYLEEVDVALRNAIDTNSSHITDLQINNDSLTNELGDVNSTINAIRLVVHSNSEAISNLVATKLNIHNINTYDCNTLYDSGIYEIKNGANCPSGSQFGQLFVMAYRQHSGNTKPDFSVQIFLPNGDDTTKPNSMFYRTSLGDSWNEWNEVGTVGNTLKSAVITTAIDFNTLQTTGVYHINVSGCTNTPSGNWGTLYVDFSVGTPYQIYIPDGETSGYFKRKYSGGWGSWIKNNTSSELSNGTGTAGLIKTTSTVTSNSGYTPCPVINGVPYYKAGSSGGGGLENSNDINGGFNIWTYGDDGGEAYMSIEPDSYITFCLYCNTAQEDINISNMALWSCNGDGDGGSISLGLSSHKWSNIYATNGTIQTSDRNEKNTIVDMTTEQAEALIYGLKPSTYKMNSGTSGRSHWGMISQDIEELLESLGWTSLDFAGFIKSPKVVMEKITDESGKVQYVEKVIEGEYIYSLRYDEFVAPLIKVVQDQKAKIDSLEKRLAKLEAKLN